MAKKKSNFQLIKKKFFTSYFNLFVIFVCIIGCLLLVMTYGYGAYAGLIGSLIGIVILFLVAFLLAQLFASLKVGKIKQAVRTQGSIESFDQEDFKEIADSKYFFVGKEWLLWNINKQFEVMNRDSIIGVSEVPGQNPNNDLGQLAFQLKGRKEPLRLTYDIVNHQNCAVALNQWLGGTYDPTKKICPHCMAPNELNNIMCDYCGSPL